MAINLSNAKKRDAIVALESVRPKRDIHYLTEDHNAVITRRLLKTDVAHDLAALTKKEGDLGKLGEKLVTDDPEIDIEQFGTGQTHYRPLKILTLSDIQGISIVENKKGPHDAQKRSKPIFAGLLCGSARSSN